MFFIRCAVHTFLAKCNYCFLSMRCYQVQLRFMSYPCWQFNKGSLNILLNIIRTSQCAPAKPIKFAAKNNSVYLIHCKEKSLEFNFSNRLLRALYVLCLLLSVKLDFSCVDICIDAKREFISLYPSLTLTIIHTLSLSLLMPKNLLKEIYMKWTYICSNYRVKCFEVEPWIINDLFMKRTFFYFSGIN